VISKLCSKYRGEITTMTTEETIAEFETKLAACKTDEERCAVYQEIAFYLWQRNLPLARDYTVKFIATALKSKSLKYCCQAYQFSGVIHSLSNEFADALSDYHESLNYATQIGDEFRKAQLHDNIGASYAALYLHEEAIDNYHISFEKFLKGGKPRIAQSVRGNLAATYRAAGMSSKAKEVLLELIAEGTEDESIYFNIADECIQVNDLESAEKYLEQAETCITENTITRMQIVFFVKSAQLYTKKEEFDKARDFLTKASKLLVGYESRESLIRVIEQYGELYSAMRNWHLAEQKYLEALHLVKETKVKHDISRILNFLKENSFSQGDYKKAFEYANEFIVVEKEIKEEQVKTMQRMLDVKQKFAVVQKEKEITEEKNKIIEKEKQESERLLLNILPAEVAEELKAKGFADAKHFTDVTVLFTDFVGFTSVSEQLTPQQLVNELHSCFKAFDEITSKYNIEKIKTVGDAYLAVCGLPLADENHADNVVNAAIEIKEFMLSRRKELGSKTFEIRIGVHSGSVVAGIVGVKKFAYDIWGDTVNTAARMEQNSEANKINISEATYELVKDKFTCEYRGEIEAKNKGKMKMYFVV
jgi:class 3 adenylate cyclase/Flp pilus assembly protein TadD